MEFKLGQRVINRGIGAQNNTNRGKHGVVTNIGVRTSEFGVCRPEFYIRYDDGCTGQGPESYYKPETDNKSSVMKKVSSMFKALVDADTRTLKEAGFINGDLELTDDGKAELVAILFAANKDALVKIAKEYLEEAKANNK
jgi:hypothetical protein